MLSEKEIETMCFVFGSNESGIHGGGAALYARKERGAVLGMGFGLQGTCFAIPTKDWTIQTLNPKIIDFYIQRFIRFARLNHNMRFQVTQLGCGLANLHKEQIAPMFNLAPDNCYFDEAWKPILGPLKNYWGTFR